MRNVDEVEGGAEAETAPNPADQADALATLSAQGDRRNGTTALNSKRVAIGEFGHS